MAPEVLKMKLREYHQSLRDGKDAEAEALAVELAPFFDAAADAQDRDPKAITPQWGLLA